MDGVFHTSRGKTDGVRGIFSCNRLACVICFGQIKHAFGLATEMNRAFSAQAGFLGTDPGRCPWAGMNQAFGLSELHEIHRMDAIKIIGPFETSRGSGNNASSWHFLFA